MNTPDQTNETENETNNAEPDDANSLSNLPGDLAAEMRVAVMKTSRRLRLESSSETLTPAQYSVLAALRIRKYTIGELAQREQIAAPSMTRIIKNLSEAGWVTRAANTEDARQVHIEISKEGLNTFVAARGQRTAWLASRIEQLGEEDRKTLARAAVLLQEMSAA